MSWFGEFGGIFVGWFLFLFIVVSDFFLVHVKMKGRLFVGCWILLPLTIKYCFQNFCYVVLSCFRRFGEQLSSVDSNKYD